MKAVVAVALALAAGPAVTSADRAACTPDAFRFCLGHALIGDAQGVAACLIAAKPRISNACRAVLTAHGF